MNATPRSVELELPRQLYGNNLPGLFTRMRLAAEHVHGDRWRVRAATNPDGTQNNLVTARTLAGPQRRSPRLDMLHQYVDTLPAYALTPQAQQAIINRRAAAADAPEDLSLQLRTHQMELMVAPVDRCRGITEQISNTLGRAMENGITPIFRERSIHVVTVEPALYSRSRLPAIVLRIAQDPALAAEIQAGTPAMPRSGQMFDTAAPQSQTLVLKGSFLGPLWGALLPDIWAFPCPRLLSTTVFGLGRTVSSWLGGKYPLLELLPTAIPARTVSQPAISPAAVEDAIDWWVHRIDQMYRYLTDPATYTDPNGQYAPHEQLHWTMTIEQILRLTTALQIEGTRDTDAQRVLAFNLLGSFADRLLDTKRIELTNLFDLDYARGLFDEVKTKMPASVGEILLPAAQRAIDALQKLQQGFFISRQRGISAVVVQMASGATKSFNLKDAAARLMLLHRNATHGYGPGDKPKSTENAEINARILAQHNGDIPGDIALLPYLYLLAVLANPEQIHKRIIDNVAAS